MGEVKPIFEHTELIGHAAPILAFARIPGDESQKCLILHASRDGACVSSIADLPGHFILRAIDSRVERMCRVVWRDEQLLGVEYINARTMGRTPQIPPVFEPSNVVALFPT